MVLLFLLSNKEKGNYIWKTLNFLSIEERLKAIENAGYNTFLLQNRHIFMDMLTDSGVNAMSDNQLAAMMRGI